MPEKKRKTTIHQHISQLATQLAASMKKIAKSIEETFDSRGYRDEWGNWHTITDPATTRDAEGAIAEMKITDPDTTKDAKGAIAEMKNNLKNGDAKKVTQSPKQTTNTTDKSMNLG